MCRYLGGRWPDFGKGRQHGLDVVVGRRLVASDGDRARVPSAQIQLAADGGCENPALLFAPVDFRGDGVEEPVRPEFESECVETFSEAAGAPVNRLGNRLQALRAVVDRVEAGENRGQYLGGADVARCPVAPDVLLARLQREAQCGPVAVVAGDADEAAGEAPLQPVADRDVGGVRPAESHRHAEALCAADRDVRPPVAWRLKQAEGERIGGGDHQAAGFPDPLREIAVVMHTAVRGGLLHQRAEDPCRVERFVIADLDLDAERLGAGADDLDRLRMAAPRHEEPALTPLLGPAQRHGLGGGGRLVEQRSVCDRQPGQVGDHRLEVEQRLQPALRDLGLVGRVRRVPAGVLEHVALDHRRGDAAVVAHADEAAEDFVAARDFVELDEGLCLGGGRRQFETAGGPGAADGYRYRLVHQRVQRG